MDGDIVRNGINDGKDGYAVNGNEYSIQERLNKTTRLLLEENIT